MVINNMGIFHFAELPYGRYNHATNINQYGHIYDLTKKSNYTHNNTISKKYFKIGKPFMMTNYLDSYFCVYDGEVIWSTSLMKALSNGTTYASWNEEKTKLMNRMTSLDGSIEGIRNIIMIENL